MGLETPTARNAPTTLESVPSANLGSNWTLGSTVGRIAAQQTSFGIWMGGLVLPALLGLTGTTGVLGRRVRMRLDSASIVSQGTHLLITSVK